MGATVGNFVKSGLFIRPKKLVIPAQAGIQMIE